MLIIISIFMAGCAASNREIVDKSAGVNLGFETIKEGLPVNWYFTQYIETIEQNDRSLNDFDVISDSADFAEGHRSIKWVVRKCAKEGQFKSPGLFQEFEVKPGGDYHVRFKIKSSGLHFKLIITAVALNAKSKEPNGESSLETSEVFEEWSDFNLIKNVPSDMTRIRIELMLLSPGTFHFDDVRIIPL